LWLPLAIQAFLNAIRAFLNVQSAHLKMAKKPQGFQALAEKPQGFQVFQVL
jgi:hypothetical protein